jgi:hypothetical protein
MDWEARARDAEARLEAVKALADEWERKAGPESEAWAVYGPQKVRVPFAVEKIRAALSVAPQPQPRDKESSIEFRKQWDADVASGGRHIDMSFMQDEQAAWVKCSNNGHSWHRADLPCDAKVHTPVTSS